QRQRPRTGQYNDLILGQRINHAIEHGKSPLHRHHERPATTLTTTQSSASNHAHNLEHQRSPHHQQRPRPPGQPTPRPATTPTTSNTRMTYDIDNNHDHTQATHQPPNNQPQYSGERHSGEAGRVTPGQGARTGHVTTQPSTIRHAHNLEHQRSPHHRHRRRPARRPRPRPPVTPTESNTLVEHTIDNDNGHTQTTQRPPTDSPTTSPETVAKDTPAKPVG